MKDFIVSAAVSFAFFAAGTLAVGLGYVGLMLLADEIRQEIIDHHERHKERNRR